MTDFALNREDPTQAEEIMAEVCPAVADRRIVLAQLLRSIATAEQVAPHSWAVTLFVNGFRLNVGPVEAFTFLEREVRLFFLGSIPTEVQRAGEVFPCTFRSMPQPQHGFFGTARQLQKVGPILQPLHAAYVRTAAVTSKGKPRHSPFARHHSPGLHIYAQRLAEKPVGGV